MNPILQPGGIDIPDEHIYAKAPVDEDALSLSAILLYEHYYDALQQSITVLDGVSVLTEDLLIPFKAKAYLDLSQRKAEGANISSRDVDKYRNDVFRLAQLLPADRRTKLSESIRNDIRVFLDTVGGDDSFDPNAFEVAFTRDEAIALLETAYGV